MAKFTCPLVVITAVESVSVGNIVAVSVLGYTVYCRRDKFKSGDWAIWVPVGSGRRDGSVIAPEFSEKDEGVLLAYQDAVMMARDIGVSESSIDRLSVVGRCWAGVLGYRSQHAQVDKAARLLSQKQIGGDDAFSRYTSIENYRRYPNALVVGENVCITEKLHGTSARYGYIGGKYRIGTKRTEVGIPDAGNERCAWGKVWHTHNMVSALNYLTNLYKNTEVGIYGEIVGDGIQSLGYGHKEPAFYCYDIQVGGRYLEPFDRYEACAKLGLKHVPVLSMSVPWYPHLTTVADGATTLGAKHIREGIIVEPVNGRWLPEVGRVKLKVLGEAYLTSRGRGKVSDVERG